MMPPTCAVGTTNKENNLQLWVTVTSDITNKLRQDDHGENKVPESGYDQVSMETGGCIDGRKLSFMEGRLVYEAGVFDYGHSA
jgi:hypothetical protein